MAQKLELNKGWRLVLKATNKETKHFGNVVDMDGVKVLVETQGALFVKNINRLNLASLTMEMKYAKKKAIDTKSKLKIEQTREYVNKDVVAHCENNIKIYTQYQKDLEAQIAKMVK